MRGLAVSVRRRLRSGISEGVPLGEPGTIDLRGSAGGSPPKCTLAAFETMTGQTILIVFNGADSAICDCGELMMGQGAAVQWVPDVYTAMAQFASGNVPHRLIVDVRQLDEHELAFLELAPRYYPKIRVTVPVLDGTSERLNGRSGKFEVLSLTDINDEFLGIRSAVTAEEPVDAEMVEWQTEGEAVQDTVAPVRVDEAGTAAMEAAESAHDDAPVAGAVDAVLDAAPESGAAEAEEDPFAAAAFEEEAESVELDDDEYSDEYSELADDEAAPLDDSDSGLKASDMSNARLSTDGRANESGEGPALHEAVRQRMGGSQTTPSRRVPPGGYALGTGPARPSDAGVTPEELDALLRSDRDSGLRGIEGGS